MEFKKATLLAVIGTTILLLIQIAYLLSSYQDASWEILWFPAYYFDLAYIIGYALLLTFFISLYKKQH